ncbi:MAG: hypothetical protein ACR2NU_11275, partial [Aeoliella sp.]
WGFRPIDEGLGFDDDRISADDDGDPGADDDAEREGAAAEATPHIHAGDRWVIGPVSFTVDAANDPAELPGVLRTIRATQRAVTTRTRPHTDLLGRLPAREKNSNVIKS